MKYRLKVYNEYGSHLLYTETFDSKEELEEEVSNLESDGYVTMIEEID